MSAIIRTYPNSIDIPPPLSGVELAKHIAEVAKELYGWPEHPLPSQHQQNTCPCGNCSKHLEKFRDWVIKKWKIDPTEKWTSKNRLDHIAQCETCYRWTSVMSRFEDKSTNWPVTQAEVERISSDEWIEQCWHLRMLRMAGGMGENEIERGRMRSMMMYDQGWTLTRAPVQMHNFEMPPPFIPQRALYTEPIPNDKNENKKKKQRPGKNFRDRQKKRRERERLLQEEQEKEQNEASTSSPSLNSLYASGPSEPSRSTTPEPVKEGNDKE